MLYVTQTQMFVTISHEQQFKGLKEFNVEFNVENKMPRKRT